MKHGGLPVISPDGGHPPPQMLPLFEFQPSTMIQAGAGGVLQVLGPQPGKWFMVSGYISANLENHAQPENCSPQLSGMAEYLLETNIIRIIPSFYNYQDIKTFYTVKTSQTFQDCLRNMMQNLMKKIQLSSRNLTSKIDFYPAHLC